MLAMLVLAVVVTLKVLSHFSCWCCMSHYQMDLLCETLRSAANALERAHVPYFACYGSAFLAMRDADYPYQTVPWEHDIDLCIHRRDHPAAVSALAAGLNITVTVNAETGQQYIVPNPYPLRMRMGRGYVDLRLYGEDTPRDPQDYIAYQLAANGDIVPFKEDGVLGGEGGGGGLNRAAIGKPAEFKTMKVCGVDVKGPADPLAYVLAMVGPTWKDGPYRWPSNINGQSCRLFQDCKIPLNQLPPR